jgi:predicted nucleic acid-binding protein
MTLIDTSAWIEFFRAKGEATLKSKVADLIFLREAAYTCPVRFELFLGSRPEEREDLGQGLEFASRIPLGSSHWDQAALLGARLRKMGMTLPASDLLIAALAHREKIPILARDQHFEMIQSKLLPDLKLSL